MNVPRKENCEHTKRNGILSTAPNVMTYGKILQTHTRTHTHTRARGKLVL